MRIVKLGGGQKINISGFCTDLAATPLQPTVIIHGANYALKQLHQDLHKEEKRIISPSGFESRYSDQETMELFTMVYCGLMNKKIVAELIKNKVSAVGLSGIDGGIWQGPRKPAVLSMESGKEVYVRDNYFMKIEKVNDTLLSLLLEAGYVPVLTAPGVSNEGEICNLDNDRGVAATAKALGCKEITYLIEAPGILQDPADEQSLMSTISRSELAAMLLKSTGGMKRKLSAIQEALESGVEKVFVGDGRVDKPLTDILEGQGTTII